MAGMSLGKAEGTLSLDLNKVVAMKAQDEANPTDDGEPDSCPSTPGHTDRQHESNPGSPSSPTTPRGPLSPEQQEMFENEARMRARTKKRLENDPFRGKKAAAAMKELNPKPDPNPKA